MRKGELAQLRNTIAVQQSQIDAWRATCGTFIKLYEDEKARVDHLNSLLYELKDQLAKLSACPSK